MEFNPWEVKNLDEFLFYCCPECDVKTKEQSQLFEHALEAHESSHESLVSLSNIKKEPVEQSESNFTFKCDECNFNFAKGETPHTTHKTGRQ